VIIRYNLELNVAREPFKEALLALVEALVHDWLLIHHILDELLAWVWEQSLRDLSDFAQFAAEQEVRVQVDADFLEGDGFDFVIAEVVEYVADFHVED